MTKEEAKEIIKHRAQQQRDFDEANTSDWGGSRSTRIDWKAIGKRMPKHAHCTKVISPSGNTVQEMGLYCKEHGKLYQWINYGQAEWLLDIGVDIRM